MFFYDLPYTISFFAEAEMKGGLLSPREDRSKNYLQPKSILNADKIDGTPSPDGKEPGKPLILKYLLRWFVLFLFMFSLYCSTRTILSYLIFIRIGSSGITVFCLCQQLPVDASLISLFFIFPRKFKNPEAFSHF